MLYRALAALVRRFAILRADRRGQVALTFGLAAMPTIIMIGSAIDYSRAVAMRSNLQQATDSTVLAIAHSYLTPTSTCQTLFSKTQTYLTGTMNTTNPNQTTSTVNSVCGGATFAGPSGAATLQTITLSDSNQVMCVKSTLAMPTVMMNIAGIPSMTVTANACSKVAGTYEVAMALDNSFSMSESLGSQTKMQALHDAAIGLVKILIPDGATAPTAAISLVPFNALVNVGTSRTASFIDSSGKSSLTWDYLAKPTWVPQPSRFTLFDTMNVPWAGCVEDRPNNQYASGAPDSTNYLTTDVAPSSSNGESLFVPYFAPDDPGDLSSSTVSSGGVTQYYNDFLDCQAKNNCSSNTTKYRYLNSYIKDAASSNKSLLPYCTSTDWDNDNKSGLTYPGAGSTLSCKYRSATPTINTKQWFGLSVGPNSNCTTPQITPLTTKQKDLTDAINAMQPEGLTNLGTGFMWAWRTISPTVNPYPMPANSPVLGQQSPKAYNYGPPANTKVIILMTDGYNTWSPIILTSAYGSFGVNSPNLSAYESFGYMTDNRLANYSTVCPSATATAANTGSGYVTNYSGFRCQMDNMLLEGCTNAKNKGVTIFTVGFSTSASPIDQQGINVLKACASNAGNYYQAATGDEIKLKFQQIAAAITNLRLTQ